MASVFRPRAWLGIDVGYSDRRRSTGICAITEAGRICLLRNCFAKETPDRIAEALRDFKIVAIGIDGPLVPAPEAGRWLKTSKYRDCEATLSKDPCQKTIKPGQTSTRVGQNLHEAATKAARQLSKIPIFEAFPNAFLGGMLKLSAIRSVNIPRGKKSDIYWEMCLGSGKLQDLALRAFGAKGRFLGTELPRITNHDQRAAVVCALTAKFGKGGYAVIGKDGLGAIMLAPRQFIERWLLDYLDGR